jgi:hypothetical protein
MRIKPMILLLHFLLYSFLNSSSNILLNIINVGMLLYHMTKENYIDAETKAKKAKAELEGKVKKTKSKVKDKIDDIADKA